MAYVEFHIEQGPVLEELRLPLGVVEAIAGQSAWSSFSGPREPCRHNAHASAPRRHRAAAAEWIVAVEQKRGAQAGLVATVGQHGGKTRRDNVIAGEASRDAGCAPWSR